MQSLHRLDILPTRSRRLAGGVVKLGSDKELHSAVWLASSTARGSDLLDQFRFNPGITNRFHHRQMFQVVMCLEQGVSSEELYDDASDRPHVARKTPAKLEYNFWGPVMPCGDDR